MTGAPAWEAATAGQPPLAAQVNQFLATHAIAYLWTGALQAGQGTAGAGPVNSDGLYIAQSFTTGASQTAIGYVVLTASVTGSPGPLSLSVQANSAGAPSGTALVTTMLPKEFVSGALTATAVMLPAAGLTASTAYWAVAAAEGDASDYYSLGKSNQASGTSTSTNGTAWTAQAYGLLYQIWDQTPVQPLAGTWEDTGARWTSCGYDAGGQLSAVREYTAGQAANGYTASSRALTWAAGDLTGVA